MKRIEFIAPVEAMRGNLSGKQTLLYPTNDNKAFDAPQGVRSYAKNYRPSFIGAKRASDGLKYFGVRTKSAVKNTIDALKNMAALAVAAIGYYIITMVWLSMPTNTSQYKNARAIQGFWDLNVNNNGAESFRKYVINTIRDAVLAGTNIVFDGIYIDQSSTPLTFYNPFINVDPDGLDPLFNDSNVGKYVTDFVAFCKKWWVLAPQGIEFKVLTPWGTVKCLAYSGYFSTLLTSNTPVQLQYDWSVGESDRIVMTIKQADGSEEYYNLEDPSQEIITGAATIHPNITYTAIAVA